MPNLNKRDVIQQSSAAATATAKALEVNHAPMLGSIRKLANYEVV